MHRSTRRQFVDGVATGLLLAKQRAASAAMPLKAVVFDAFPILDPRPVATLAERLLPGQGARLSDLWRIRQFENAWLRTLSHRYADFWRVTEDALLFASNALAIDLTDENRRRLMGAWLKLTCWPDVSASLGALKSRGLKLALLSNMTPQMLKAGLENSGLEKEFDGVFSTDSVKAYKPDPRAYGMAVDAFRARIGEILFVAFAGWDAAGARSFGYRTFWVNRQSQPPEELGTAADAAGTSMNDLVAYVEAHH